VAFVDASTLVVRTVEAGNGPTYLAPVPVAEGGVDAVVVLNVLSHDASYLRAANGQLTSVLIPGIAPRANAWAVSADGRWALAWTDTRLLAAAGKIGPRDLDGFQDVTAIDLAATPPVAATVAVGFRPVSLRFDAQGRRAFAATEDGVTVIGLPGPSGTVEVLSDVPLGPDPSGDADTRDVSITAAGRAVVRHEGSPDVGIVDLGSGAISTVAMSAAVTDIDVTADGSRAVAVARATGEVAVLPLPAAMTDPASVRRTTVSGQVVGSVALTADGQRAVLYSNATDAERLTVLELEAGELRSLRVHAPVLSVHPTPDGKFALVVHRVAATGGGGTGGASGSTGGGAAGGGAAIGTGGAAGGGGAGGAAIPATGAFTVIPLDGSRSGRIEETDAPPQAVAFSPASERALVTVRNDRTRVFGVHVVALPSLQVGRLALASPPISAGVVAGANRGFVAQRHPEGRITFIPFTDEAPRTITGFELGARIVDGDTQ
jgi:hypothetical protein